MSVLISRTAGYAIRLSGGVGGALSDGRPYPDMCFELSASGLKSSLLNSYNDSCFMSILDSFIQFLTCVFLLSAQPHGRMSQIALSM